MNVGSGEQYPQDFQGIHLNIIYQCLYMFMRTAVTSVSMYLHVEKLRLLVIMAFSYDMGYVYMAHKCVELLN